MDSRSISLPLPSCVARRNTARLLALRSSSSTPSTLNIMSSVDRNRPLDLSWEEPLPHALTPTRTYLSTPCASTQVAIVAIHGRGDSARDFADAFVPHLQSFFGTHLQGEVEDGRAVSSDETEAGSGGVRVTLRALEAQDGIWFGTHTRKSAPLPSSSVQKS